MTLSSSTLFLLISTIANICFSQNVSSTSHQKQILFDFEEPLVHNQIKPQDGSFKLKKENGNTYLEVISCFSTKESCVKILILNDALGI